MKLLILHLSDMHFIKSNSYSEANVDAIVSALQENVRDIKDIIIIISGDLTFSGFKAQYDDTEKFILSLKGKLCARYHFKSLNFAIVPGNHDVNYQIGLLTKDDLKQIEAKDEFEDKIPDELKKMHPFLAFAQKYSCYNKQKNSLIDILKFNYGQKVVQINLINSGVFSSLDEDQGYHYIRSEEIEKISENNNSDFVFTVMHHPHHWYSSRVKKELEKALYERNDVIFCGHEHYDSQIKVSSIRSSVLVNEGGMLCNDGKWDNSRFYVYSLDLDTRKFTSVLYSWEKKNGVYCGSNKSEFIVAKNRANSLGISPKEDYVKALLRDDKYALSDNINDYFVFPSLKKEEFEQKAYQDLNKPEELLSELEQNRYICIQGNDDDGKTTLAKYLFQSLVATKVAILLDSDNIRKANPENIIRDAFSRIYSDENPFFEYYDELLDICREYDVTISLGDACRPGCIDDATDAAQVEELMTLGELTLRAWERDVQVMIEGPGHMPMNQIAANMEIQKTLCHGAPFYVLGPLVTDIAPGYDHITSAIGGAMAAWHGAAFLCYVTPAEHLRLPDLDDVKEGIMASKIAAHAADIAKGLPHAMDADNAMAEARHALDWEKMFEIAVDPEKARSYYESTPIAERHTCSMCGKMCAVRTTNMILNGEKVEFCSEL